MERAQQSQNVEHVRYVQIDEALFSDFDGGGVCVCVCSASKCSMLQGKFQIMKIIIKSSISFSKMFSCENLGPTRCRHRCRQEALKKPLKLEINSRVVCIKLKST